MQAFIFDMDGVIIDSEPLHIAVEIKASSFWRGDNRGAVSEIYGYDKCRNVGNGKARIRVRCSR